MKRWFWLILNMVWGFWHQISAKFARNVGDEGLMYRYELWAHNHVFEILIFPYSPFKHHFTNWEPDSGSPFKGNNPRKNYVLPNRKKTNNMVGWVFLLVGGRQNLANSLGDFHGRVWTHGLLMISITFPSEQSCPVIHYPERFLEQIDEIRTTCARSSCFSMLRSSGNLRLSLHGTK